MSTVATKPAPRVFASNAERRAEATKKPAPVVTIRTPEVPDQGITWQRFSPDGVTLGFKEGYFDKERKTKVPDTYFRKDRTLDKPVVTECTKAEFHATKIK